MSKAIIANFKANGEISAIRAWIKQIAEHQQSTNSSEQLYLALPACYLIVAKQIASTYALRCKFVMQDISAFNQGSYTGEIPASMAKAIGADGAIIGHSERREHLQENDVLLKRKLLASYHSGLTMIYCVGESKQQRESGQTLLALDLQLKILHELIEQDAQIVSNIMIAYEPIWAIGTGATVQAEEITGATNHILSSLSAWFNDSNITIPVLYGGSVNEKNARMICKLASVNGLLVGKASLQSSSFIDIIKEASHV